MKIHAPLNELVQGYQIYGLMVDHGVCGHGWWWTGPTTESTALEPQWQGLSKSCTTQPLFAMTAAAIVAALCPKLDMVHEEPCNLDPALEPK